MSMERFDVIVVGLGAVGSATTYHLAKTGVRVLGIDRYRPPHGMGSSHGDTRITREAVGEGEAYVPLVRRSHQLWRELEAESGESLLQQTGVLIMSPAGASVSMHGAADFMTATTSLARRHSIAHEVLAADELARRFPQFRFDDAYSGYFEPGAGWVRAEAAVHAHVAAAKRHGAVVRCGEEVVAYSANGSSVDVQTQKETYSADRLVLAAGAWLPRLVGGNLARLFTIYRQVVTWFEASDELDLPVFIWQFGTGEEDVFYGFPALNGPSGGVKIGTEKYRNVTTAAEASRDVSTAESNNEYTRCVRGRLPGLGPQAVRSGACLYTVTPDFGFVLDRHPEHANVVVASACSGHGFKHSPAVGETIAQLATGEPAAIDVTPFSLSRFIE